MPNFLPECCLFSPDLLPSEAVGGVWGRDYSVKMFELSWLAVGAIFLFTIDAIDDKWTNIHECLHVTTSDLALRFTDIIPKNISLEVGELYYHVRQQEIFLQHGRSINLTSWISILMIRNICNKQHRTNSVLPHNSYLQNRPSGLDVGHLWKSVWKCRFISPQRRYFKISVV